MYSPITEKLSAFADLKLFYAFGSRVDGTAGPISDYDFAFYTDTKDSKQTFQLKVKLLDLCSRMLKSDDIDMVAMNQTQMPALLYNIVVNGQLLYEVEAYKTEVEPRIWNNYFDFQLQLQKNGLLPHDETA